MFTKIELCQDVCLVQIEIGGFLPKKAIKRGQRNIDLQLESVSQSLACSLRYKQTLIEPIEPFRTTIQKKYQFSCQKYFSSRLWSIYIYIYIHIPGNKAMSIRIFWADFCVVFLLLHFCVVFQRFASLFWPCCKYADFFLRYWEELSHGYFYVCKLANKNLQIAYFHRCTAMAI